MFVLLAVFVTFFVVIVVGEELQTTRPSDSHYCPRFDYEYKLLERLVRSEFAQNEMEASILQLQQKLKLLETEVLECKEIQRLMDNSSNSATTNSKQPTVAFYAGLSNDIVDVSLGYRAVMDKVFLNQGEVYDVRHGSFRAPYTGVYGFSIHVCSPPSKYTHLFMMKEGQSVGFAYEGHSGWSCSGRSVVIMMQKGENVWLEMAGYAAGMISKSAKHVEYRTSFSGFFIGAV